MQEARPVSLLSPIRRRHETAGAATIGTGAGGSPKHATEAADTAAAPQPISGADIRAFVNSLPDADAAAAAVDSEAGAQQQAALQQSQQLTRPQEAAEAGEAASARQPTDFLAGGPEFLDLAGLSEDFRPLSSRNGGKGGKAKKRARQEQVNC